MSKCWLRIAHGVQNLLRSWSVRIYYCSAVRLFWQSANRDSSLLTMSFFWYLSFIRCLLKVSLSVLSRLVISYLVSWRSYRSLLCSVWLLYWSAWLHCAILSCNLASSCKSTLARSSAYATVNTFFLLSSINCVSEAFLINCLSKDELQMRNYVNLTPIIT